MKLTDRFWHYFFLNPVAWFLLLLLIVAVYSNYKLNRQLDTVCDWIKSPDEFIDKPNNALRTANRFLRLSRLSQQLRQLGDIRRNPPRLIVGEQLGRRSPPCVIDLDPAP